MTILPAVRSLRREPGLVAGIVATMAIAIGVTATMLDLVTRLMLAPPPGIANPDRVARLMIQMTFDNGQQFAMSTTSYPTFRQLAARTDLFSATAAVSPNDIVYGEGEDAREIRGVGASGAYFSLLGATPSRGRLLGPSDDELPFGQPVAVLSYEFWKAQFHSAPDAIGRTMLLGGTQYTVVGVAAPDFSGDNVNAVDVFIPLSASMRNRGGSWASDDYTNIVSIVARLKDGVSTEQAAAAATAVMRARADDNTR